MNTIIIDDEKNIRDGLKIMLQAYSDITIIAEASNVTEAKIEIERYKPELVFLDIKLKNSTGFNLLDDLEFKDFKLVFITAYNEYAIKAFKYNAFDYLLKPIVPDELKATLSRLKKSNLTYTQQQGLPANTNTLSRLVIKTTEQIYVLDVKDIVRCESDKGYTFFHLKNKTRIISSKTLKEYNGLLPEEQFLRVHQSHLVNVSFIKKYLRNGTLELLNAEIIPVSIRKRNEINKRLSNLRGLLKIKSLLTS